jgi:DNA-binding MarR family transcriptional regulator
MLTAARLKIGAALSTTAGLLNYSHSSSIGEAVAKNMTKEIRSTKSSVTSVEPATSLKVVRAAAPQDVDKQSAKQAVPNTSQISHVVAMHRLIKVSYLITQPFFINFADRYEISMNELRIVMTLAAMPNAAAHELGRATGMHPMNVSRALASLTAAGRITKRSDSAIDRRRKIIALTAKGWTLHNKLLPHVKKMAEFIFETMSDLEVEFLSKLVRRVIGRLEDTDPSSPLVIDADAIKAEGNGADVPGQPNKPAAKKRKSAPED